MPKKRKTIDLSDNCRICLGKNDCMADIYLSDILEKIKEVANSATIHIDEPTDNGLPRKICHICLHRLEEWCDFRSQFIRTNKTLVKYLDGVLDQILAMKRKPDSQIVDETSQESSAGVKKIKMDVKKTSLDAKTNVDNTSTPEEHKKAAPKLSIQDFKMDFDDTSGSQIVATFSPSPPAAAAAAAAASPPTTTTTTASTIKLRPLGTRKTNEQRQASTKRWEDRKKALVAANGNISTDSDSVGTDDDDAKLSPIQKARLNKSNNIQQKDTDYQKNAIKNLSPILNDKDSFKNTSTKSTINNKLKNNKSDDSQENTEQLELIIGDETFIITTNLSKTNSPFINKIMTNDLPTLIESKNDDKNDCEENNSDIFDAVKLRRIKPNDDSSLKHCLKLEVAANDIESLKRIQTVIHKYIDNDLKKKLLNNNNNFINDKTRPQDSFQSLEQKLKTLIDNSVRNNVNKTDGNSSLDINAIKFQKAAEESPMFQPVVRLCRLELTKYNNNTTNSSTNNDETTVPNNTITTTTTTTTDIIEQTKIDTNKDTKQNSPQLKSVTPKKSPSSFNKSINDFSLNDYTNLSDEDSRHVCGDCGAVFTTQEEVELHFDNHTTELRQDFKRCSRCKVLVENGLIKSHVCLKICTICDETFKTKKKLDIHMKKHKDTGSNVLTEHLDNTTADDTDGVEKGVLLAETTNKTPMTTETLEAILADDPDQTTTSLDLDVKSSSNQLEIQEEKSAKIQTVQCGMCPYKIPIGMEEIHVKEHLEQEGADDTDLDDGENVDNKTGINVLHDCVQCTDKFTTEDELAVHMQTHEDGETTYVDWDEHDDKTHDKHVCTICDMSFDNEKTLSEHFDTHNNENYINNEDEGVDGDGDDGNDNESKPHYCILCGETLLNSKELALHIDQHVNEGL